MKIHLQHLVLLTVVLHLGCTNSLPAPSLPLPVSDTKTAPETPVELTRGASSWKITPTGQAQTFSSLLTTVVTQLDVPMPRRDSLKTQTSYSINTTRNADSLVFSGSITSFAVRGVRTEISDPQVVFPILFNGKISNHNISIQASGGLSENSGPCDNATQASMRTVHRNLFLLPLEIIDQQTWTDSTSSTVCSGTIPLTITSIRTFRVLGESESDGTPALALEQNERTSSRGEGSQGQHRILIESQGTTNGRLYVDRTSGQFLAANLVTKTSVSIQSSGRVEHFSQLSTEVTQRIQ